MCQLLQHQRLSTGVHQHQVLPCVRNSWTLRLCWPCNIQLGMFWGHAPGHVLGAMNGWSGEECLVTCCRHLSPPRRVFCLVRDSIDPHSWGTGACGHSVSAAVVIKRRRAPAAVIISVVDDIKARCRRIANMKKRQ